MRLYPGIDTANLQGLIMSATFKCMKCGEEFSKLPKSCKICHGQAFKCRLHDKDKNDKKTNSPDQSLFS